MTRAKIDIFSDENLCPFIRFQPCRTDCALNVGVCALVLNALASQKQRNDNDGWCIECRQRPIFTASKQAGELELCEPCYRKKQIKDNEERKMLNSLRKAERYSAAEAARVR